MSSNAPVIAAYKGPAGRDVLSLAKVWCRTSGRPLRVVTVYPSSYFIGMGRTDAEWVTYNRQEAQSLLAEAREIVGDEIAAEFLAVGAESASRGLHEVMDQGGPDTAVVVGSRKTRGVRRTALGSTVGRLLQGAPGPVVLVPWDYEISPADPIRKVAVGYIDTPDGNAAFTGASRLAGELKATLTVISVVPDTRVMPSMGEPHRFGDDQRQDFRDAVQAKLNELDSNLVAETRLLEGPVVDTLADLKPDEIDLLVCGSRGYGPARSVLLGGVSSRLLRHARVPVMVVPRG